MLPRQKKKARTVASAVLVTVLSAIIAVLVRKVSIVTKLTVVADGQFGIRYWEVARNAFARGDGFPLWDNSVCAGHPFLGNPDTQLVSSLIVGLFRIHGDEMARWYPTVGVALACAGTFVWCRRVLELSRLASMFAGALFAASGFLILHTAVRMTYVPFVLIPWALWLVREGERDERAAAGLGLVLALMLLEGGLFPFCFAVVALGAVSVPRLVVAPGALLRAVGIAAVVCALIAAIKVLPTMAQLSRAPRVVVDTDAGPFTDLIAMLGDSDRAAMPGRRYHVNEFNGYIGPLAFGMAIAGAGAALILKPRRLGVALLLLTGALLTRGHFSNDAPWTLLTKLPVFNQLQVPSRFVLLVDLAAAVAAAIALDAAMRAVNRPMLKAVLVLAAIGAIYDPIGAGRKLLLSHTTAPWLSRPDPTPARYHLVNEDLGRIATLPARNVGTPTCQKPWPYPEGSGYAIGEVPQAQIDAGRVTAIEVKQNEFVIDAIADRPTVLHINQTFDADFVASVGQVRRSPRGTLEVAVPAGTLHIEVRYRPKGLITGVIGSVLGIVAFIGVFVLRRRSLKSR